MATLTFPTDDELEKLLEPTAMELGKLVFAYNRMQDKLGLLYWAILGKEHSKLAAKNWHEQRSDGLQRKLLREAAATKIWPEDFVATNIQQDIEWLLDEAKIMGEQRNDAMHASYVMLTNELGSVPASNFFSGNPRAKNLAGKNLLTEFLRYRKRAEALAGYARTMHYHILFTDQYLHKPERPHLSDE